MRVVPAREVKAREVDRFDSLGFSVSPLAGSVHGVLAHLEPGGRIGRHPAVVDQILVLVQGDAVVSGDDLAEVAISPGDMVVWRAKEAHETRSAHGMVALILESEGLADAIA